MTGALAGLRVVELGTEIAAPYCTKLLVDVGADVCKIERPSGDPLRRWGTAGGLFEYLNAGKRGLIQSGFRRCGGCIARFIKH